MSVKNAGGEVISFLSAGPESKEQLWFTITEPGSGHAVVTPLFLHPSALDAETADDNYLKKSYAKLPVSATVDGTEHLNEEADTLLLQPAEWNTWKRFEHVGLHPFGSMTFEVCFWDKKGKISRNY